MNRVVVWTLAFIAVALISFVFASMGEPQSLWLWEAVLQWQ